MPVPTLITDLSTTAGSNFPLGSDSPSSLDDTQRAHASFIATIRDTVGLGTGTLVPATARTNFGAAASGANGDITSLTALTTVSGNPNFSGAPTATTATAADSSTKVATTAFVQGELTSQAVKLTGTQTVAGVKTLSNTPVLSAGATFGTATMANPSGTAPVFGARAWCVFDGTLTGTNAPTAGGNITSITRNSAGNYTVNFTTAMPDANYAVMVCGASTSSVNFTGGGSRAKSTTSFTLDIGSNGTGSAIPSDRTSVELIIFR